MRPLKIPQCRLPLSMMKPTISNQLMVTQEAAPLHPPYVCWFNSCEKLTDWTIDTGMNGSIDNADKMENTGSLALDVPIGTAGFLKATLPFPVCDEYWGFWAQISKTRFSERFSFVVDADHWYKFYTRGDDKWGVVLGAWHWLEIQRIDEDSTAFYIDGDHVWTIFGTPIGIPVQFKVEFYRQAAVAHGVKVDYVRQADRLEYPPV